MPDSGWIVSGSVDVGATRDARGYIASRRVWRWAQRRATRQARPSSTDTVLVAGSALRLAGCARSGDTPISGPAAEIGRASTRPLRLAVAAQRNGQGTRAGREPARTPAPTRLARPRPSSPSHRRLPPPLCLSRAHTMSLAHHADAVAVAVAAVHSDPASPPVTCQLAPNGQASPPTMRA